MSDHLSPDPPVSRRLRALAFDPSLATQLETSTFNEITLEIPWEEELGPGPIGEYIEVVDYDPASGTFCQPVDLNHPHLLAQQGLAPSESNPQFHQQMVYAVAMKTIRQFERALGRVAFWGDHRTRDASGGYEPQFVRRLRIYPHALRDRNAYYSPSKKALLFGYFPVTAKDKHNTPGTVVFTCLSHDIIAHEVTHALLDGVHPRFNESTNHDVHAFHEAFADLVALFQHFSYPEVLLSQVRRTRGDLESENLLSQLAQQFGRATGRGGELRNALGGEDPDTGRWEPATPDPRRLSSVQSPHARGAILVAAVFRAFLRIYRASSADLYRIATNGTGVLPEGEIHPDLAKRLAEEAAKCADRVLQMCIRAIDYCPPVDITFGDFLRGVITADIDYAPDDPAGYRVVFIESFREWGIHPRGVTSLGQDALAWPSGDELAVELALKGTSPHVPQDMSQNFRKTFEGHRGSLKRDFLGKVDLDWTLESDRFQVWRGMDRVSYYFWKWLHEGGDSYGRDYADIFGLVIDDNDAPPSVFRSSTTGGPALEVHSVRPAIRRTRYGGAQPHLVVEITQRRRGYFDKKRQKAIDSGSEAVDNDYDFVYRAGCTILIDPSTQEVRRCMRTPGDIADDRRLARVRNFLEGATSESDNAFDAGIRSSRNSEDRDEPFALLHQTEEA